VKAGLKLSPTVREVTVIDRPIDGIGFIQYRAKISGTVHCLGQYVSVLWVGSGSFRIGLILFLVIWYKNA